MHAPALGSERQEFSAGDGGIRCGVSVRWQWGALIVAAGVLLHRLCAHSRVVRTPGDLCVVVCGLPGVNMYVWPT
jgi:hypothetical protein